MTGHNPPTDELDHLLRTWGQHAVAEEARRAPESWHAPQTPSRWPHRLATVAAVVVTALVAGGLALWDRGPDNSRSADPGARSCVQQFTGRVVSSLDSLPPTIEIRLSYTGRRPCVVDAHPPALELIDGRGRQVAAAPEATSPHPRTLTAMPGDELGFGISRFLGCIANRKGSYTLRVFFGTVRPGAGIAVDVSREATGSGHGTCADGTLGLVSPLRSVSSSSGGSTAAPSTSTTASTTDLAPPDQTGTPARGLCALFRGATVTLTINPDTPAPEGCLVVTADQHLRVVNNTGGFHQRAMTITIRFARFAARRLAPGDSTVFAGTFGSYLAAGQHSLRTSVYGAIIWFAPGNALRCRPFDAGSTRTLCTPT